MMMRSILYCRIFMGSPLRSGPKLVLDCTRFRRDERALDEDEELWFNEDEDDLDESESILLTEFSLYMQCCGSGRFFFLIRIRLFRWFWIRILFRILYWIFSSIFNTNLPLYPRPVSMIVCILRRGIRFFRGFFVWKTYFILSILLINSQILSVYLSNFISDSFRIPTKRFGSGRIRIHNTACRT